MNKIDTFKNLESIFIAAINDGNFTAALKAQELLAKHTGVFDKGKSEMIMDYLRVLDYTELESLIAELEIILVAGEGLEPPTRGL
jgi:hypothetical protein